MVTSVFNKCCIIVVFTSLVPIAIFHTISVLLPYWKGCQMGGSPLEIVFRGNLLCKGAAGQSLIIHRRQSIRGFLYSWIYIIESSLHEAMFAIIWLLSYLSLCPGKQIGLKVVVWVHSSTAFKEVKSDQIIELYSKIEESNFALLTINCQPVVLIKYRWFINWAPSTFT